MVGKYNPAMSTSATASYTSSISPSISNSTSSLYSKQAAYPDHDSHKKKRPLDSNTLKRRMEGLADLSSYKKSCRDSVRNNNHTDSFNGDNGGSEADEVAINYHKNSKLNLELLKSKSVKSLRQQQQESQLHYADKPSYSPLQPGQHQNSSNSTPSKQHSTSLTSVSSIPANQLRAHVNRADADEITDLEELEQFAKTFKQRRIKLGKSLRFLSEFISSSFCFCRFHAGRCWPSNGEAVWK